MTASNLKKGLGASTAVAAIVAAIFAVEGGYVNDPRDPGGETNHGITKRVAVANGYTGPMIALAPSVAEAIYTNEYIYSPGYDQVVELSPAVGHKVVDAGVNAGTSRSSRWLQTALNALNRGGKDYPPIYVDGRVGPSTVSAYKALQKVRGKVPACELILKLLDAQQAAHYMSLGHLNVYTPGWVAHRIGNVPLSRCKEGA